MADKIAAQALKGLLGGAAPFALIDVREAGEYNSSHIPGASLIARRQLELSIKHAVPLTDTHVVLCDDDGRRAQLAAASVERLGYRRVSVLDGGINRWVTDGFETEWGSNVPSKDFGEKVEVVNHVPEIEAKELAERMRKGEKFVILDSRTPEEFRRFCIPTGRNVPGGELALRITDIAKNLEKDTTIIVNCAGRTRSIIGARALQRMGVANVYGLKNGTAGWLLAGHQLESGADRGQLAEPSAEGVAAAGTYAGRVASGGALATGAAELPAGYDTGRAKLKPISPTELQGSHGRAVIFDDTSQDFARAHVPGARWVPRGWLELWIDGIVPSKSTPVTVTCVDGRSSVLAGATLRDLGYTDASCLDGGLEAGQKQGLPIDRGLSR